MFTAPTHVVSPQIASLSTSSTAPVASAPLGGLVGVTLKIRGLPRSPASPSRSPASRAPEVWWGDRPWPPKSLRSPSVPSMLAKVALYHAAQRPVEQSKTRLSQIVPIKRTFRFGRFGRIISYMRNVHCNNVGGYMKGRCGDCWQVERLPALPSSDVSGLGPQGRTASWGSPV